MTWDEIEKQLGKPVYEAALFDPLSMPVSLQEGDEGLHAMLADSPEFGGAQVIFLEPIRDGYEISRRQNLIAIWDAFSKGPFG